MTGSRENLREEEDKDDEDDDAVLERLMQAAKGCALTREEQW